MAARILVVNDTQEILELFRTLLEEEGYEVILSGFPIQQINDVVIINPDLIILDFVFFVIKKADGRCYRCSKCTGQRNLSL